MLTSNAFYFAPITNSFFFEEVNENNFITFLMAEIQVLFDFFNKFLLYSLYVPGTVLGLSYTVLSKTNLAITFKNLTNCVT